MLLKLDEKRRFLQRLPPCPRSVGIELYGGLVLTFSQMLKQKP
jgi:hypothetical protein